MYLLFNNFASYLYFIKVETTPKTLSLIIAFSSSLPLLINALISCFVDLGKTNHDLLYPLFQKILQTLLSNVVKNESLLDRFDEYAGYDDVRFHTLKYVHALCQSCDKQVCHVHYTPWKQTKYIYIGINLYVCLIVHNLG